MKNLAVEVSDLTVRFGDFEAVKKAVEDAKIAFETAEVTMLPSATVKVEGDHAKQVLELVEDMEDLEDVQNVYANFDIAEEQLGR